MLLKKYFTNHSSVLTLILIFLNLLQFISNNEKITDLKLNETTFGTMIKDNLNEYFKLTIPPDIKKGRLLVFTVKESIKGVKDGDELFSDPDIYVSKKNIYPKSKDQAEWYSQKYGNDILTIPSEEVKPGEVFYVGMYCEFKCRYELNSYLADEVEVEIGKVYSITLKQKSSLSYYVNIPKNEYDEFNLVATSPNLKSFKIFMSKNSPSSQNTFKVIPSWTGGYMISIEKYSNDYCTNCKYYILIQSQEKEEVNIQFYAYFQDTITSISSGNTIYDAVKNDRKRCYSYDMKVLNMREEKILIHTTLFSGSALLYISGEKKDTDKSIENAMNQKYSYQIQGEKIIMLEKSDIDKLNSEFYIETEHGSHSDKGLLHFCIYGKQLTSFILNVYSLSEASKLQKYNYISPGTELTSYLKGGDVTRYRILDFNKNKNSNITITFTSIKGITNFYTNFCWQNCNFNKQTLENKIEANEMLYPRETSYSTQTLIITPKENKCYQNNDDDKCKILLVMKCSENIYDYCSYKMLVSISDQPILMYPKKTYYNIIPKGKDDFYEIVVEEVSTPSIVVVLTTVTGDAELTVYKKNNILDFGINEKDSRIIAASMNSDYIPDVVRITPQILNEDNITGRYLIKVTGTCFSSYNLYYYSTRSKVMESKLSINDISASLSDGQIIRDFFPNDLEYKIYMYTPNNNEKKDIKFILTRINVGFAFKIFNDFKKINILNNVNNFEERIKGYIWASDQNNEVTISKDDKNYSNKNSYFIVVYKNKETIKEEVENNNLDKKSMMAYYIGVTKLGTPFTLYEVIEHSETLSNAYLYQNYWYIHINISESFLLDINVLSGEVDVYININQLPIENITDKFDLSKLQNSVVIKTNINNYASIELDKNYFRDYCSNSYTNNQKMYNYNLNGYHEQITCKLYIYIVQSKSAIKYQKDSQYIISAKSSQKTGKILLSGQVITGEIIAPNTVEHFFIEEVKHRKGSTINVKFTEGFGELYVRVPKKIEIGRNITYPNETNFDYKGKNVYMGQVVTLPPKLFDRIDSTSLKLQILITVIGTSFSSMNSKRVKFTISYSSEPKRINQNVPYTNHISAGEYHFYTLYFNQNTKNIYIALSNMNGDADLYLNYGIDKMPSPTENDWYSVNMGHEYIDIDEDDKFFVEKKLKTLAGYYSLLVVGFTETSYTLFVSSHDEKIFPLNDNLPISCRCESKGDKCFYRYDNIFRTRGDEAKFFKSNEIIFTSQYIYGNGKMYANLLKDQDITYDQKKKYLDYFPDDKLYQFSNAEFGKRNYMKVNINENQYSKDSLILMTFICEEKTDVEITAASLSLNNVFNFLDKDRENIFYLKYNDSVSEEKQKESIFSFYSSKDEDIIYEIKAYLGMARIKVFTNETIYNSTTGITQNDYNHIAEFTIKSDNSYTYNIYKMFVDSYINSIQKKLVTGKRVYFSVKPMTNFGFYLQILYDREWVNLPINKDKSYLVTNNQMYGYFDIYDNFQNIEMSISLDDFSQKIAKIYVKIIVVTKNYQHIYTGKKNLFHYEIPSKYNNDYTAQTNNYLGTMNININNLPILKEQDKENKSVRALFGIEIQKTYRPRKERNSNNDESYSSENIYRKETNVRILVSPSVNNFKRIDVLPNHYYFSQTDLIPTRPIMNPEENVNYNGNKEIKIYSLDKINDKDDKMIIQINSCSGNYEIKLSKKIVTYNDNSNDLEYETIGGFLGRKTILIKNLRNKHVYLSIRSVQNEQECSYGYSVDRNNNTCSPELSYLLFYYTTSSNRQFTDNNIYKLQYRFDSRAKFYLIVPQINNIDKKYLEYNIVWTKNETLSKKMESVCHLIQILNKGDSDGKIFNIEKNLKINSRNEIFVKEIHLSSEPIYINLLVRNNKNNELISFEPIMAKMNSSIVGAVVVICILIIIFVPCYIYYDEIRNKFIDLYLNGFSLDNLFGKKNETVKYSNLSNSYY